MVYGDVYWVCLVVCIVLTDSMFSILAWHGSTMEEDLKTNKQDGFAECFRLAFFPRAPAKGSS